MWWQYLLAGVIGAAVTFAVIVCIGLWCCLRIDKDNEKIHK